MIRPMRRRRGDRTVGGHERLLDRTSYAPAVGRPNYRARGAAGRRVDGRRAGRRWSAAGAPARAGWQRCALGACTAAAGRDQPRGSPRPARTGKLGGARRRAGRGSRADLAGRPDRRHLPRPARPRRVRVRRSDRGPLRRRARRSAVPARARRRARPGAVRAGSPIRRGPRRLPGTTRSRHARRALGTVRARPPDGARAHGRALAGVRGVQPRPRPDARRAGGARTR